ncbi:DAK2 domain-containing protein [Paenibacillus hamazuiensis]|uniref:DAK2 domain-containing protein n=1 Tax=Paenibacillus hamazuiensis TaxID=2936508 RepID=UPI00200BABD4|nr:DAK2 domain-containing protein [Paenibacillus hamazuiensis]
MSKRLNRIDGHVFYRMVMSGAQFLQDRAENVNALNVFPVPDGDTGTNMGMSVASGAEELKKRPSGHIGQAAEAFAKGLLMGARGNSGVILSQLFRGFAKAVQDQADIDAQQFAAALQTGVDTAYKAVVKPVEGTILTVSREAAKMAVAFSKRTPDVAELLRETVKKGYEALEKTPDYLPVLKQVGVVDAGGQGLLYIYDGFLAALVGDAAGIAPEAAGYTAVQAQPLAGPAANAGLRGKEPKRAQAKLATEDIEHGYCTEFMIKLAPGPNQGQTFDEAQFRKQLAKHGDSLLVACTDELVKIHIHAEQPGDVMNLAMRYGELTRIKIENMREQHTHILEQEEHETYGDGIEVAPELTLQHAGLPAAALKRYGLVAVSAGSGISDIFRSLGVDEVLFGGQSMNPSTEQIVQAAERIQAETVFVLPNNSNIVMAARQAADMTEGKTVIVIPSKSIPQGIAAALAFQEQSDASANEEQMTQATKQVKSAQVTVAVRDTEMDGIDVKEGDYIGLVDGKIVASHPELLRTCGLLLESLLADGAEVITVYAGEDARQEQTERLAALIGEHYPDSELEIHDGGQPLYHYILSAE